jgi:hypothetical protein
MEREDAVRGAREALEADGIDPALYAGPVALFADASATLSVLRSEWERRERPTGVRTRRPLSRRSVRAGAWRARCGAGPPSRWP